MSEPVVYDRNSNQIQIGGEIRQYFQRQFSIESVSNRPFLYRMTSDEYQSELNNNLPVSNRKGSDECSSDPKLRLPNRKGSDECPCISNWPLSNRKGSDECSSVSNWPFSNRKGSEEYATFDEEFNTSEESKWKGMMKSHYVDKKARSKCNGCRRKFSIKLRPRHCRRCGEVYCIKCLQQKTKLNKSAVPDPSGKLRKVCATCYGSSIMIEGCTRSSTEEFVRERTLIRHENILKQRVNSLTTTFWRDQLDIGSECQRLLVGFERVVAHSESKKTFQEIRNLVDTPSWQRSKNWTLESKSTACRACKGGLGIRKHRRNCRVCGLSQCKKCSQKELLVYYPDITDTEEPKGSIDKRMMMKLGLLMVKGTTPKLAIIKTQGAPTVEPSVSLLLHICSECRDEIAEQQINGEVFTLQKEKTDGALEKLVATDDQMKQLQDQISEGLSKCKVAFEAIAEASQRMKKDFDYSALQMLESVERCLVDYDVLFKALKNILTAAETKTQTLLIRNYSKSKFDFYMESRQEYRYLRRLKDEL